MSDNIQITREPKTPSVGQTTFPTEIIDLPSKGTFYPTGNPLSKGSVEIKMMTAREEDILTNTNLLKKGIAIDKLFESLIVDKSIIVDDLITGDKDALMFAVRRLAYGDSYGPVDLKCPRCEELNKLTIDISKFEERDVADDIEKIDVNEFSFDLPYSKTNITFKMLNGHDEKNIQLELEKLNKISYSELFTRLRHMILSVGGDRSRNVISDFINNKMVSRDSLAFRKHIRSISPGVDSSFDFICSSCGHEERSPVPMTVQFFWPDV